MNAWAGWRLRIPGGPVGGQYHGFIAPDDLVNNAGGWPAGHHEIFRPIDTGQNLGIYPWHPWDPSWVGTPLREGETVSDFVYRSPAELRPRPNASGGINVVRAVQYPRTPGYAVAPGNYKTLGMVPVPVSRGHMPAACPAWGCGSPPWARGQPVVTVGPITTPAPVVAQPPPPTSPQPAPITAIGPAGSSGCAAGQYRDAAGNCTSDWRNPYPMYLPLDNAASPSPTVSANTCPTGYTQDPTTGNCLAPGMCPSGYATDPTTGNCLASSTTGTGITAWLQETTSIAGMNIPNYLIAAVGVFAAVRMMRKR